MSGPEHPVQRRMLGEIARWTGVPTGAIEMATDGCGVPCFGIPLATLARAAARFAAAAARGEAPAMVVSAMTGHPFMVAGRDRLCTALMAESPLGLFAKVGAEGVYMAGCPDRGLGVALKVEDGAWRAAPTCAPRRSGSRGPGRRGHPRGPRGLPRPVGGEYGW